MSLITVKDAASTLRVSERTVRRWIETGKVRAVMDRGRWWVKPSEVSAMKNKTLARVPSKYWTT